jgi:GT2 family glycosyltransferase
MPKPNIYTIVVTHNGSSWIEACLQSLFLSSCSLKIVVVDNGSTDNTRDIVNNFSDVKLYKNTKNIGFGSANNIGINYALSQNADYVLLLNQDTKIDKFMLENLIDAHSTDNSYGILSPLQMDYEGEKVNPGILDYLSKNSEIISDGILGKFKQIYVLPFIPASAWLIPRAVLEIVGGFDSIFFMYGEDSDYCNRIKFHGYKVGLVPNARVLHWHSAYHLKERNTFLSHSTFLYSRIVVVLKDPQRQIFVNLLNIISEWAKRLLYSIGQLELKTSFVIVASFIYALINIRKIIQHRSISISRGNSWLENNSNNTI